MASCSPATPAYVLNSIIRKEENASNNDEHGQVSMLFEEDGDLKSGEGIRIFIHGVFDLMHYGHMNVPRRLGPWGRVIL